MAFLSVTEFFLYHAVNLDMCAVVRNEGFCRIYYLASWSLFFFS